MPPINHTVCDGAKESDFRFFFVILRDITLQLYASAIQLGKLCINQDHKQS